jgi:hypothetical protein
VGIRIIHYDAVASPLHWIRLSAAIDATHLQIPIAAVVPLGQAALANARLERGHVLGRTGEREWLARMAHTPRAIITGVIRGTNMRWRRRPRSDTSEGSADGFGQIEG